MTLFHHWACQVCLEWTRHSVHVVDSRLVHLTRSRRGWGSASNTAARVSVCYILFATQSRFEAHLVIIPHCGLCAALFQLFLVPWRGQLQAPLRAWFVYFIPFHLTYCSFLSGTARREEKFLRRRCFKEVSFDRRSCQEGVHVPIS